MGNKTCQYRNICRHSNACYETTRDEENWCPYAKKFWDKENQKEIRDYWRNPVGYKKGIMANIKEDLHVSKKLHTL